MIAERIAEWRRGLAYSVPTNSYRVTCEQMEDLTDIVLGFEKGHYVVPRALMPRTITRTCEAYVVSDGGAAIALLCGNCGGIMLNTDATFCPHCGARVASIEDDGDELEEVSNG